MWGHENFCSGFGWWWIVPVVMLIMFAFRFFVMRKRMGIIRCGASDRTFDDLVRNGGSESAKEILDKRYACGEIGKAEYEQTKKDLES